MVYNGILMETIGIYLMVSIGLLLFFLDAWPPVSLLHLLGGVVILSLYIYIYIHIWICLFCFIFSVVHNNPIQVYVIKQLGQK